MQLEGVAAAARPAAVVATGGSRRDVRIDFLRGLALLFIFVDHVPDSLFSLVTLQAYAFADAAELFFFLSGFVAAMVYGRMAETKGMGLATRKIWRRVAVLYGAQILLFVLVLTVVWLAVLATGHGDYQNHFRFDALFAQPYAALVHTLLLRFQPAYLDILPLYVLFLAVFPLVLIGLRHNLWLVLLPSAGLWLMVQVWTVTPHTFPHDQSWFFNPLAWQFLFVLGASLGHPHLRDRWQFLDHSWLLAVAIPVAAIAAVIQLPEALRMVWPDIVSLRPDELSFDKQALEPLRLVSFLALGLLARRFLPRDGGLGRNLLGRQIARCGRHSLEIFCAGVVLSVVGGVVAAETGHSLLIQFVVSLAGIALLFVLARFLDRSASKGLSLPSGAQTA